MAVGTQPPDGGRSAKRRNGLFGFCTIHDEIDSDTPLSRGKEDLNVWKRFFQSLIQISSQTHVFPSTKYLWPRPEVT